MKEKNVAIVLAAGRGSRMKSKIQKQYLLIKEKPILYYSMKQFEECPFIHEIILVTGQEEIEYCKEEIVEKYHFSKVSKVISGGKERWQSVYNGLKEVRNGNFVYIHDGARPFINQEMLLRIQESVRRYEACVVGMPVKDTIKISDENSFAVQTPKRDLVWIVQTPQAFRYDLIKDAYDKLVEQQDVAVTDDAMVLEATAGKKVKLVLGSYENIKITTPEDLKIAEVFCS